ncbi:hypothetical protein K270103H11_24440 [Gordonibacter urolithinfaciens]
MFGAALALQRGSVALLSRHCHAPGTGRGKPAECGGWAGGRRGDVSFCRAAAALLGALVG